MSQNQETQRVPSVVISLSPPKAENTQQRLLAETLQAFWAKGHREECYELLKQVKAPEHPLLIQTLRGVLQKTTLQRSSPHKRDKTVERAMHLLASIGDPVALPFLVDSLFSDSPPKDEVFLAYGEVAVKPLGNVFRQKHDIKKIEVLVRIIRLLGQLKSPMATSRLLSIVGDCPLTTSTFGKILPSLALFGSFGVVYKLVSNIPNAPLFALVFVTLALTLLLSDVFNAIYTSTLNPYIASGSKRLSIESLTSVVAIGDPNALAMIIVYTRANYFSKNQSEKDVLQEVGIITSLLRTIKSSKQVTLRPELLEVLHKLLADSFLGYFAETAFLSVCITALEHIGNTKTARFLKRTLKTAVAEGIKAEIRLVLPKLEKRLRDEAENSTLLRASHRTEDEKTLLRPLIHQREDAEPELLLRPQSPPSQNAESERPT